MRIAFLLHNAYGVGGTTRTTLTLAEALSARHSVELVSVFRYRERPHFAAASTSGLPLTALVDRRRGSADRAHPMAGEEARLYPRGDSRADRYDRLAEQRIVEWFGSTDADVIVTSRAGLNVLLGKFGPRHPLRIAQEHLTHDTHGHALRLQLMDAYRELDALVTVTEPDARDCRRGMRLPRNRTFSIPNGVPASPYPPADGESATIVAAGRLARLKRYPMLVDAFARISDDFPHWTLRIYGDGPERERLARHIQRRGLDERVLLMGPADPMEAEWPRGSLAAVSSAHEPFGMTIVEAMRAGLPVVSTDCRYGPGQIIRDGVDGRLVPRDDIGALASGLAELMGDPELRSRMGHAAIRGARRFEPAHIATRYEALFDDLAARRRAASSGTHPSASTDSTAPTAPAAPGVPEMPEIPVTPATPTTAGGAPRRHVRDQLSVTRATVRILIRGALRRGRRLAQGNTW